MNHQCIMSKKILYVDLRRADEVNNLHLNLSRVEWINIPAENVRFNLEHLEELSDEYHLVYFICNTGNRSKIVKEKYFEHHKKFKVCKNSFSNILSSPMKKDASFGTQKEMSTNRKTQIISAIIIIILSILSMFNDNFKYVFFIFGLLMFYVGFSGNCFMSKMMETY